MAQQVVRGRVLTMFGKNALVDADGVVYSGRVAGRLKKGSRAARSPVAVGDWVSIELDEQSAESGEYPSAAIVEVEQRKTCLSRASAHDDRLEQVVAANVDQLVVVIAANDIDLHLALLDRLLVTAWHSELTPLLVANKIDLSGREAADNKLVAYRSLDVALHLTSATAGDGIEGLRNALACKTSVFAGPSGVGKSSILNALAPGLELRTGDVRRSGAGRHTTTSVSLLRLPFGGYVVDTPGVREFGLWNVPKDELGLWYPDFANYRTRCRYPGCSHSHEPECAVRAAVESGAIERGRYERYVQMYEQLETEQRSRYD